MIGSNRLHLMRNPADTWSFVGRVPVDLRYENREGGGPISEELAKSIAHCGGSLYRDVVRVRTWMTEGEARAEAARLGFEIAD